VPVQADQVFKTFPEILTEVLQAWVDRIPDIAIGPDTIVRLWSEVFANSTEGVYLGLQLLHDDMFIQTMSSLALDRAGDEAGRPRKAGVLATGTVRFTGTGGEYVPVGSQVGALRPALGDTLIFETTDDATIPSPGTPDAPTVADAATSGNLTGTIEWAVTFTTSGGETEIGDASNVLTLTASRATITVIPVGGAGTLTRKIYRRLNGGDWKFVHELADNSTTTYTDNITDGSLGGAPPDASTAERVTVTAQAISAGGDYNVSVGAVTSLVSVDADVSAVTNPTAFEGGVDDENTEAFRQALLAWKRAPQNGSANDLVAWATSIDGVSSATVYKNVNLAGTPTLGTVAIRIAGPNSAIPDSDKIDEVQAYIDSRDLANITIVVGTFTPLTVVVEVTVTVSADYLLADVLDSVQQAAANYVNSVPVGGTVYVAGIYWAIFNLPGIDTLTVDLPAADVVADDDEKPTIDAADVTVNEA
jgi:uncharacterized phage protein gp47/JayE